ncbi:MAG: histidine phosphatase family protein [Alphaproteobacteria bacterium]
MSIGLDDLTVEAAATPLECERDRFYFVRHGQTAGNFSGVVQVPTIQLDATGEAQAAAAGVLMAKHHIDLVVASPFKRAYDTGVAVAGGRDMTVNPNLAERLFGEFMGTPAPKLDWTKSPKGGESMAEFIHRTRTGFTQALSWPGEIAMVAHGGNLRVIAAGLGVKLTETSVTNAHPLLFERANGAWRMTELALA